MDEVVQYETADGTAMVTLNRPEKRNALNQELVAGLHAALERAEQDDGVRVVVLTGAGDVFCAGADLASLRALQHATAEENLLDSERLARLYERIYQHPKPIIAKVNGHAIAGGCGLAAVCDLSIAAEHARFGFTEVRIGFVPAIVSVFVLRKVGETTARDLLLRGRLVSAEEARTAGLITQVVPAESLDDVVEALATEFRTETSGTAVALTKRLLGKVPGMGFQEALTSAAEMNAFARGTEDCRAGIEAFLERKDPPWRRGKT